jgi:hypothetical protein
MPIQIKDTTVLEGLLTFPAHPTLIKLLAWFSIRYSQTVITCGWEKRGRPSTHDCIPYRAVDVRSTVFEHPEDVEADINQHWIYDPERHDMRCAVYHDIGRGAHIHLQVHELTKRVE